MKNCDHKFVGSNVCLKCGIHIDALNQRALDSLKALTGALRDAGIRGGGVSDMTPRQLHEAVDVLLAQFVGENPGRMPSKTSVIELLRWNKTRW